MQGQPLRSVCGAPPIALFGVLALFFLALFLGCATQEPAPGEEAASRDGSGRPDSRTERSDEELRDVRPELISPTAEVTLEGAPLRIPVEFRHIEPGIELRVQVAASEPALTTGPLIDTTVPFRDGGVELPADGLSGGSRYVFRLGPAEPVSLPDEGVRVTGWSAAVGLELRLEVPATGTGEVLDIETEIVRPAPGAVTVDPTPEISWAERSEASGYDMQVATTPGFSPASVVVEAETTSTGFEVPEALERDRRHYVRVRVEGPSGLEGRWSEGTHFEIRDEAPIVPIAYADGEESFRLSPFIGWAPVYGAERYQFQLSDSPQFDDILVEREVSQDARLSLGHTAEVFPGYPQVQMASRAPGQVGLRLTQELDPGREYVYRVRVINDEGTVFDWSGPFRFVAQSQAPELVTVAGPEEVPLRFPMGYDNGDSDEAPFHEVELTVPYAMTRFPVTNLLTVRLLNWAARVGFVRVEEQAVVSPSGRRLVGLSELAYGTQFGIVDTPAGLAPTEGRDLHPAVGMTWYGAILIADLLSIIDGVEPAYASGETIRLTGNRGYRVPTEAEWAYAARGADERLYPWGVELSGRRANFFRSGDPFEAVSPPYTQNGGPTTPVDLFGGAPVAGFSPLSNESHAGAFDLVGNVWEWCWDWYGPELYGLERRWVDPRGPSEPEPDMYGQLTRVVRGTAWNTRRQDVRLTNRGRFVPGRASYSIGLRLVRALEAFPVSREAGPPADTDKSTGSDGSNGSDGPD